jgi:tetratricopeptide (TPR) repeat protein
MGKMEGFDPERAGLRHPLRMRLSRAIGAAHRRGDERGAAQALCLLGDIEWSVAHNAQARRCFEQVLRLALQAGLGAAWQARAWHGLAKVTALDARPQSAQALCEQSLAQARRTASPVQECESLALLGWTHLGPQGSGQLAAALSMFERCRASAAPHDGEAQRLADLGRCAALAALGRFGEALAGLASVRADAHATGRPRIEAMALIGLAECRLEMEQPGAALQAAEQARAWIDDDEVCWFATPLHAIRATALMRTRRVQQASGIEVQIALARRNEVGVALLRGLLAHVERLHRQGRWPEAAAAAAELQRTAEQHRVPEMVLQALRWQLELQVVEGAAQRAGTAAGDLLRAQRPDLRFSLRLALLRLASRGRDAAEFAPARDAMQARLAGLGR